MSDNLLGIHCSVSGGVENAFIEANAYDITAMQIFSRNQRQWRAKPISESEAAGFKEAWKTSKVEVGFSHCSYLLNLCSDKEEIIEKSLGGLQAELERCNALGLRFCVLHPGSHGSRTLNEGLDLIAAGLKTVIEATEGSKVRIAVENTAGQGTSVGGPLENLQALRQRFAHERIGYCLDTCHAYAAGYDISTRDGIEDFIDKFDKLLGLDTLLGFHLNDSKGKLGTHLDRHEHIGQGEIGETPFAYIMQKFPQIPKVIETPKSEEDDRRNLSILRSFVS